MTPNGIRKNNGRRPRQRRPNGFVNANLPVSTLGTASEWTGIRAWDPFPRRTVRQLSYATYHALASQAVTGLFGASQDFALGGLYDPDVTGAGHQPYGFDQLMALYARYKVLAVTVSITAYSASSDSCVLAALVMASTDAATLVSQSLSTILERPGAICIKVPPTGTLPARVSKKWTIAQLDGLTTEQHRAVLEDYSGTVAANPTFTPKLKIALVDQSAPAGAQSCWADVHFLFDVEFYDRIIQAAS